MAELEWTEREAPKRFEMWAAEPSLGVKFLAIGDGHQWRGYLCLGVAYKAVSQITDESHDLEAVKSACEFLWINRKMEER